MLAKLEIRQRVKQALQDLPQPIYQDRSLLLAKELMDTPHWKSATTVALTAARFPEVDTFHLIETALREKKQVALPRTSMADRTMHFYYIQSLKDLEKRSFGLMEPIPNRVALADHRTFDLIVVPGVAFTASGKRLGLGGGFYDRFLPKTLGVKVALCFSEQLFSDLPIESHDVSMDFVISDGDFL